MVSYGESEDFIVAKFHLGGEFKVGFEVALRVLTQEQELQEAKCELSDFVDVGFKLEEPAHFRREAEFREDFHGRLPAEVGAWEVGK